MPFGHFTNTEVGIYLGLFIASYGSILNRKWRDKITISLFFILPLLVEKMVMNDFTLNNIIRFIVGIFAGFGIGIVSFSVFKELFSWLKFPQKEVKQ